jgi:uncharacterized protein YbaR (Trm112 family)
MGTVEVVACPSCENEVEPVKRKLPGEPDTKGRIGSPVVQFGHVCPICATRLDATIEKIKREHVSDKPSESNVVPIREKQAAAAPVRNANPVPGEDLIDRIRREHSEALREEQELIARLAKVKSTREKLDRLMSAIASENMPIAAE